LSRIFIHKLYRQLLVSAAANLGSITTGMTAGFSAVALPALQSLNHDPVLDDEDASWVAIGAPVGSLLMGPMLEKLGRKWTLIVTNMPAVIGWVLVVTAFQPIFIPLLYLGRLLTGLAAGLVSPPAVVYCGEVVDKGMRGVVVTFPSIGVSLGMVFVYTLGAILKENWRMVGIFSSSIPIISMILVWFMVPESPVWLASRGRTEAAEASMRAVRNLGPKDKLPEEVQEELDCMIETKNNKTILTRILGRTLYICMSVAISYASKTQGASAMYSFRSWHDLQLLLYLFFPFSLHVSRVSSWIFYVHGIIIFFCCCQIFPALKDTFEYNNVFTFYAVMCLAGTLTMYKFLP
ncbi:hypothetical protein L9F63_026449, partial [Diploptera punctata]